MQAGLKLLRLPCSTVPPNSFIARKASSKLPLQAICVQCHSLDTAGVKRQRPQHGFRGGKISSRSLHSTAINCQENDKAMEERLQRLKRDFEVQKAAEEAKKKAEEERLRKEKEERDRRQREEAERLKAEKEKAERAAREEKERQEREAMEKAKREEELQRPREWLKSQEVAQDQSSARVQVKRLDVERTDVRDEGVPTPSTPSPETIASPPPTQLPPSKSTSSIPKTPPPPRPLPKPASSTSTTKPSSSLLTANGKIDWTAWTQQLPSHTANLRFEITKRFHRYMEHLLNLAAIYSQRLNIYTGTDYTGISALRTAISSQEQLVRSALHSVAGAKDDYAAAFAAQAASQKEVVQLLERKHSWTSSDLERYMALIRSEHINEQGVQRAKEQLAEKERELEEVRSALEKSERRLYHEEQIWSDTIRRNSTWVTFGLMGLNILLLLVSLALLEPWRRRRLVREIRRALDEKVAVADPMTQMMPASAAVVPVLQATEAAVNANVEPVTESLEQIKHDIPDSANIEPGTAVPAEFVLDAQNPTIDTPTSTSPSLSEPESEQEPEHLHNPTTSPPPSSTPTIISPSTPSTDLPNPNRTYTHPQSHPQSQPQSNILPPFTLWAGTYTSTYTLYKAYWADLFSERSITLKQVEVTHKMLEGAAAGAAFMGLVFLALFPRGG